METVNEGSVKLQAALSYSEHSIFGNMMPIFVEPQPRSAASR